MSLCNVYLCSFAGYRVDIILIKWENQFIQEKLVLIKTKRKYIILFMKLPINVVHFMWDLSSGKDYKIKYKIYAYR